MILIFYSVTATSDSGWPGQALFHPEIWPESEVAVTRKFYYKKI